MSIITDLMRDELKSVEAYDAIRSETTIILDANESPWPPFGTIAAQCDAHRYAEPQPVNLRQRLGNIYGVAPEQILLSRGSDEGIDMLVRLFCRAGIDNILVCPPTFVMYETYAAIQNAGVMRVPLRRDDWQLDVPAILAACTDATKLIFIPTPQAPMGHLMKREDILALCEARQGKSLIISDEAYMEFTETPQGLLPDLARYPNLVVLRTLSKAHALAGERVGAVVGSTDLIDNLRRVIPPYPITQSSLRAALEAVSPNGLVLSQSRRRILVSERERMAKQLLSSPYVVSIFPSVANFLLLQTKDSAATVAQLAKFGIRARNRNSDIANTVRLSIGSPDENDLVLQALGVDPVVKAVSPRLYSVSRHTKETKIDVTVDLDQATFAKADTGIGFFDHMLMQIAQHGAMGIELHCQGDLNVDQHHSIEDCALALGEAIKGALGDKRGIGRYGFTAPLDEALAEVVVDLSGRAYAVFEGDFPTPLAGAFEAEMVPHFFRSLATSLGAAIHVKVKGDNTHHMIEACFKAFGRALRQAVQKEGDKLPSTKGVL